MKAGNFLVLSLVISMCLVFNGCGKKGAPDKKAGLDLVAVEGADPLYYISVENAEASSFDETPDWAPEPNPKAPVDGDMLTRWSSSYMGVPQWISFDLGKESVISDIMIRWERAYATKFKVLVSKDGQDWGEVFAEEACKGGVSEITFAPVRCRYVRIEGTEKVEEDWGISIWEVEIYGPQSHNPGVTVSKDKYLAKGKEEEKKKEAEELITKAAGEVIPISRKPFQQGVVYTSWMADELSFPASDITLVGLKKMGFDTIAIMVPVYQEKIDSQEIFANDFPNGDTPTVESVRHAIETCHKIGLRVLLKPHVDPRTNEARVNIIASEKWFESYKSMIMKYAALAQETGVEIFSVGTELEGTTFDAWTEKWKDVIASVKGVYKGLLTYSANWTEYKEVPFWQEIDIIGIDAYFPLTSSDAPTVEELVAAWDKHADEIEAWLAEKGLAGKGVILTEIGYTSTDRTNRQPWSSITSVEDQEEQADCYEALFRSLSKRPWFQGYYIWQYMPQERWSPLGFTLKGKKAEEVVKRWIEELAKTRGEVKPEVPQEAASPGGSAVGEFTTGSAGI